MKIKLILFALLAAALVLSACAPPVRQPTRQDLLAPTGLLDSQTLVTSVQAITKGCGSYINQASQGAKVVITWMNHGRPWNTLVKCLDLLYVSGTADQAQVLFGLDKDWLGGRPIYVTDTGGEEDFQFSIRGELGYFQNLAVTKEGGYVHYRPVILDEPNNFLESVWVDVVYIIIP